jgi:hypothetical protein
VGGGAAVGDGAASGLAWLLGHLSAVLLRLHPTATAVFITGTVRGIRLSRAGSGRLAVAGSVGASPVTIRWLAPEPVTGLVHSSNFAGSGSGRTCDPSPC